MTLTTSCLADDAWPEFDRRCRSVHRRHGDPFPLPRVGKPNFVEPLTRRLDAACGALNSLASAAFDMTHHEDLRLTHVQLWMLEDLKRRIANYGEVPSDFNEEVALTDLQCNANLYTQEAKHIAKLDPNQIKILSRSLDPIPAVELAPPSAKLYLEHFDTLVERTWQEMELLRDSGQLLSREQTYPLFLWKKSFFGYVSCCEHRL